MTWAIYGLAVVWLAICAVVIGRAFKSMLAAERSFRTLERYDVLEAKRRHQFLTPAEHAELDEIRQWFARKWRKPRRRRGLVK